MSNPSLYTDSAVGAVRAYFGLTQAQLAAWLGTDAVSVGHCEAGRRYPNDAAAAALAPLLRQLPAAAAAPGVTAVAVPLAVAPTAAEAAPLLARLDECQHQARRTRRQLAPLVMLVEQAARWAAAVPALRATLPADPPTEPDPATSWAAWLGWHRHRWLDQRPTTLRPGQRVRYHLLRLRAEALETEAAALRELLAVAEN